MHRLHPYLDKFIPQLVETLLERYVARGGHVLDPFAGSGTTLVQSLESGYDARSASTSPRSGFVERGLAHFAEQGIETKRLMISDNAWTYTRNKALARVLAGSGIRHLLIPYRRHRSTARSSASCKT